MCLHKIEVSQLAERPSRGPSWLLVLLTVLVLVIFMTPSEAYSQTYKIPELPQCGSMSVPQQNSLRLAYTLGQPNDLGYTLSAIAWEESKAGLYIVNNGLTDFGLMQISLKYAKVRWPKLGTGELTQRLITDASFNIKEGLGVILYFLDYWEGDWKLAVRSYNAGFKHTDAVKYQLRVAAYVRALRRCEWLT